MKAKMMAALLSLIVLAVAASASAGVYDDVAAWWHLDLSDTGTVVNAADIRDARTWYSQGSYKATSIQGTPDWTTSVPLRGPGGGQVYGGRGLDFTPAVDGGGNVAPDGFHVSDLALGGDATLVTRFKWDGYPSDQASAWMYYNAYGNNQGWLFGLSGGSANPRVLRYSSTGQGGSHQPAWTTTPGTWYDLAVVLDDNGTSDTVTFYRWEEGGALLKQTYNVSWVNDVLNTTGTRVGFESTSGTNARKSFDGVIENLAVWNRALSETDIHAAFGHPDPAWSIGIDNNSSANFNMESSAGNDYTTGEPWGGLSRALTQYGGRQIDIHFEQTVNSQQAALPYVFHVDTANGRTATFPISLLVNGHLLSTQDVPRDGDAQWFVPAQFIRNGTNTLSLRYNGPRVEYADGGSYITWDWLELGGSWQVGVDNNSQSEFRAESASYPDDFFVTDPDWMHLERALTAGDPTINLHFGLSEEMAEYDYLYTTELYGQNPGSGNPFGVSINGIPLGSVAGSPNGTVLDFFIPKWMVQAGDNVISLNYQAGSGWTQFDYHRLEAVIPEPATLSLLGLSALALLRRRRRR